MVGVINLAQAKFCLCVLFVMILFFISAAYATEEYKTAGNVLALALIHSAVSPHYLSKFFFRWVTTGRRSEVTNYRDVIFDEEYLQILDKVSSTK